MKLRDIIVIPDKRLRLVSKPVAKVDSTTRKLVDEMFAAMYAAPGIGLAAIQLGEPKRVIRTMDERHTYEEWIYGNASLYFVDGIFKSGTREGHTNNQ